MIYYVLSQNIRFTVSNSKFSTCRSKRLGLFSDSCFACFLRFQAKLFDFCTNFDNFCDPIALLSQLQLSQL